MNYVVRYDATTNLYEIGQYIDTRFYIVAVVKNPADIVVMAA